MSRSRRAWNKCGDRMSVGSELRCRSGGAEFVILVFLGHLVLSALELH